MFSINISQAIDHLRKLSDISVCSANDDPSAFTLKGHNNKQVVSPFAYLEAQQIYKKYKSADSSTRTLIEKNFMSEGEILEYAMELQRRNITFADCTELLNFRALD